LTGLTLIAFNAFLLFFVGDNLTGLVVFLVFFGLAKRFAFCCYKRGTDNVELDYIIK